MQCRNELFCILSACLIGVSCLADDWQWNDSYYKSFREIGKGYADSLDVDYPGSPFGESQKKSFSGTLVFSQPSDSSTVVYLLKNNLTVPIPIDMRKATQSDAPGKRIYSVRLDGSSNTSIYVTFQLTETSDHPSRWDAKIESVGASPRPELEGKYAPIAFAPITSHQEQARRVFSDKLIGSLDGIFDDTQLGRFTSQRSEKLKSLQLRFSGGAADEERVREALLKEENKLKKKYPDPFDSVYSDGRGHYLVEMRPENDDMDQNRYYYGNRSILQQQVSSDLQLYEEKIGTLGGLECGGIRIKFSPVSPVERKQLAAAIEARTTILRELPSDVRRPAYIFKFADRPEYVYADMPYFNIQAASRTTRLFSGTPPLKNMKEWSVTEVRGLDLGTSVGIFTKEGARLSTAWDSHTHTWTEPGKEPTKLVEVDEAKALQLLGVDPNPKKPVVANPCDFTKPTNPVKSKSH